MDGMMRTSSFHIMATMDGSRNSSIHMYNRKKNWGSHRLHNMSHCNKSLTIVSTAWRCFVMKLDPFWKSQVNLKEWLVIHSFTMKTCAWANPHAYFKIESSTTKQWINQTRCWVASLMPADLAQPIWTSRQGLFAFNINDDESFW